MAILQKSKKSDSILMILTVKSAWQNRKISKLKSISEIQACMKVREKFNHKGVEIPL